MLKIIVIIYKENSHIHDYEVQSLIEICKVFNLVVLIYSKDFLEQYTLLSRKLKKLRIHLVKYRNYTALLHDFRSLQKQHIIVHIDTFQESMIQEIHDIRKALHIPSTERYTLFRDKDLQRDLLSQSKAGNSVLSIMFMVQNLNFSELERTFSLPFIIKPKIGDESIRVELIKNETELNNYKNTAPNNNDYVVEEYIKGQLYSIDYFVASNGELYLSPPIPFYTAKNIGFSDLLICNRVITKHHTQLPIKPLKKFIQATVSSCGIRNSFVHHEFSYSTKKEFHTIEVNGRIGGKRLKILYEAYEINLFHLLIEKIDMYHAPIKNNFSCFTLYPLKEGYFIEYNKEIFEKIYSLSSLLDIQISPEKYAGKKVGPPKKGYWSMGIIYLKHNDPNTLEQDYKFIEKNYDKLILTC